MPADNKPTFHDFILLLEQAVKSGETVNFTPNGKSMLPTILPGIDTVSVSAPDDLKKYDIILYRRKNGKIVLHRIVIAHKGYYVLCGDNQFQLEYPITKEQIIGKLSRITKKNTVINLEAPGFFHKRYVSIWDLRLILEKALYHIIRLKKILTKR